MKLQSRPISPEQSHHCEKYVCKCACVMPSRMPATNSFPCVSSGALLPMFAPLPHPPGAGAHLSLYECGAPHAEARTGVRRSGVPVFWPGSGGSSPPCLLLVRCGLASCRHSAALHLPRCLQCIGHADASIERQLFSIPRTGGAENSRQARKRKKETERRKLPRSRSPGIGRGLARYCGAADIV